MVSITIMVPKKRMHESNCRRWRFNKHKRPFYFPLEICKYIRRSDEPYVIKSLFRKELSNRYWMN